MTDPRMRTTDPEKAESNWLLRTHANYTYGSKAENRESRQKYYKRYTCIPNCDANNGGPPYFTALILILCWVCFYIYNFSDNPTTALIHSWMIYRVTSKIINPLVNLKQFTGLTICICMLPVRQLLF